MTTPRRTKLLTALQRTYQGELSSDAKTCGAFATDASMYEMLPLAVAFPQTEDEIRQLLAFARENEVPILARGAGTSLAGQTVTPGVVADFSKHFDQILELDAEAGLAQVQPGVVRDQLNAACAEHGLWFAPDPATTSRATIGGMIANNASGSRSIRYGRTIDHVVSLRLMLADGSIATLHEQSPEVYEAVAAGDNEKGRIFKGLRALVEANREEIQRRFPKVMRRVGGYCLDEFPPIDQPWNPAKIICGSEGTLAVILDAVVRLVPKPPFTALAVVHFDSLRAAIEAVPTLLERKPACVEVLDQQLLRLSRDNPMTQKNCGFLQGDPAAVQVLEFTGDTQAEATGQAEALANAAIGAVCSVLVEPDAQADVWKVRKNGLGLMLGIHKRAKPVAFIEDMAIPVEHLPEYVEAVVALCKSREVPAIVYAHASVGVIHVRPILDLRSPQDIEKMKEIAEETFQLVRKYGGAWSGEHGDGIVRAGFNERFFGEQLYQAFVDLKALFDPVGILNPHKIIQPPAMDENMRYGVGYESRVPHGVYRYEEPEGMESGIDACTGVGACRSLRFGTMCPSFRATRDEVHSTRGRANVMRMAIAGRLPGEDLTGDAVEEALDLCLSCKACKTECPSNVDMARLKAEVQQQVYDKRGAILPEQLAAAAPQFVSAASGVLAGLANGLGGSETFRKMLLRPLGFDASRPLPKVSSKPLRAETPDPKDVDVVIFADCWSANCEPQIAESAVLLLRSLGYRTEVVAPGCCQRSKISHGFLRDAAKVGYYTLRDLDPYFQANVPVVALEPSCASALTDDLPDLIADEALGARAANGIVLLETFLAREMTAGRIAQKLEITEPMAIHPHCHQQALYGIEDLQTIFSADSAVEVLQVGCCGMAGSFGHETRHKTVSAAIFNDRLGPAVNSKSADSAIAATGFSCRCQIRDLAQQPAKHWVELVKIK